MSNEKTALVKEISEQIKAIKPETIISLMELSAKLFEVLEATKEIKPLPDVDPLLVV